MSFVMSWFPDDGSKMPCQDLTEEEKANCDAEEKASRATSSKS